MDRELHHNGLVVLHHLLIVRLHEVGDAAAAPSIEHLLAVLALLAHHLVMLLLFLLQFVVEGLELRGLVRRARREDRVDVLPEGDLGTEPVHLVVVRVARHAQSCAETA